MGKTTYETVKGKDLKFGDIVHARNSSGVDGFVVEANDEFVTLFFDDKHMDGGFVKRDASKRIAVKMVGGNVANRFTPAGTNQIKIKKLRPPDFGVTINIDTSKKYARDKFVNLAWDNRMTSSASGITIRQQEAQNETDEEKEMEIRQWRGTPYGDVLAEQLRLENETKRAYKKMHETLEVLY